MLLDGQIADAGLLSMSVSVHHGQIHSAGHWEEHKQSALQARKHILPPPLCSDPQGYLYWQTAAGVLRTTCTIKVAGGDDCGGQDTKSSI